MNNNVREKKKKKHRYRSKNKKKKMHQDVNMGIIEPVWKQTNKEHFIKQLQ
jgi:hypothetical protein